MGVDFFGNPRSKCNEKDCTCTDFISKLECVSCPLSGFRFMPSVWYALDAGSRCAYDAIESHACRRGLVLIGACEPPAEVHGARTMRVLTAPAASGASPRPHGTVVELMCVAWRDAGP
jgi:hypothetical protein